MSSHLPLAVLGFPHAVHLLLVLLGLAGVLALLLPAIVPARIAGTAAVERRVGPPPRRTTVLAAAACSGAAGAVHLGALSHHLDHGVGAALGFALVGSLQIWWSLTVMRDRDDGRLLPVGALGNAALLLLWGLSRLAGVPGITGTAEPVGAADVLTAVLELVAVLTCLSAIALVRPSGSVVSIGRG